MGGKSIKNSTRFTLDEFEAVKKDALPRIQSILTGKRLKVIDGLKEKTSHGDMDIIVGQQKISYEEYLQLKTEFSCIDEGDSFPSPTQEGYAPKGGVWSFAYKDIEGKRFQIDLILVKDEFFETACDYYLYGDLFNILGIIAKKVGFRIGWDGLFIWHRNGNYKEKVYFSDCLHDAFEILSLDLNQAGLSSMDEIYKFVASSKYFHPDLYLLENESSSKRSRNSSRTNYVNFLKWIGENREYLPHYPYKSFLVKGSNPEEGGMDFWKVRYPYLGKAIKALENKEVTERAFKKLFNGNLVSSRYSVKGVVLGDLMRKFTSSKAFTLEKKEAVVNTGAMDWGWFETAVDMTR